MRLWILAALLPLAGCATPEPGQIVAFGDSYTSGTGARAGDTYPDHLAERLGQPVVSRRVHGSTAAESLHRLDDVLALRPAVLIIEFGVNEAFRGQSVASCTDALRIMMQAAADQGVPMVLVGVHYAEFQENFDAALRALATEFDAELVLDVLDGILDDPELRSDRNHPNGRGYAEMARRIEPAVRAALA